MVFYSLQEKSLFRVEVLMVYLFQVLVEELVFDEIERHLVNAGDLLSAHQ